MTSQPRGVPAQTLAAEQIRAAITNGHQITREYLDGVSDNTGLTLDEVADVLRQVRAGGAKPTLAPVPPAPAKAPGKPTLADAIAVTKELTCHGHTAIRRQATAALTRLEAIAELLPEYEAQEKARQRLTKLEAEAAKLRAELGMPGRPRGLSVKYGEFPCDVCGKVLTTAQGRGAHRTKAHGRAS